MARPELAPMAAAVVRKRRRETGERMATSVGVGVEWGYRLRAAWTASEADGAQADQPVSQQHDGCRHDDRQRRDGGGCRVEVPLQVLEQLDRQRHGIHAL